MSGIPPVAGKTCRRTLMQSVVVLRVAAPTGTSGGLARRKLSAARTTRSGWRTASGSVGAKHAAIAGSRFQNRPARGAIIQPLARIGRHFLFN